MYRLKITSEGIDNLFNSLQCEPFVWYCIAVECTYTCVRFINCYIYVSEPSII